VSSNKIVGITFLKKNIPAKIIAIQKIEWKALKVLLRLPQLYNFQFNPGGCVNDPQSFKLLISSKKSILVS
jgi:hypothetical protein